MERMHRMLRLLSVILLVVSIFSFCSATVFAAKKTVVIWHTYGGSLLDVLKDLTKKFEKQNPDIKIDLRLDPANGVAHADKLLAAISVGKPPHITMLNRFLVSTWANKGLLQPIDEYLRKDGITRSQMVEAAWDDIIWKKKAWGLPFTMGTYGLIYNKPRFREVGLNPERPPQSIAELDVAASKLTTMGPTGDIQKLGLVPWYGEGYLFSWGWAFGGSFYNDDDEKVTANDPKIVKALEWYQDYAKRYTTSKINKFLGGFGATPPISTGKLAMMAANSAWPLEEFMPPDNVGVTAFPYPDSGEKSSWQAGFAWVIPKWVKVNDQVWRVFKYLTGPEFTKEFSLKTKSNFPAWKKAAFSPEFQVNPRQAKFIALMKDSVVHSLPAMPANGYYWDRLVEAVQQVVTGKQEPKAALDLVNRDVQNELAKYQKKK